MEFEGTYDGRAQSYGRAIYVPRVVLSTEHYIEAFNFLKMGLYPPTTGRRLAAAIAVKLAKYLLEQGQSLDLGSGISSEGQSEIDTQIVYDPYTESLLAEIESSQQIESKLVAAPPRFIRSKKRERLYR